MTEPLTPDPANVGEVDDLDLALVNALQINPRASWSLVGKALEVDPVTVARRWERLSASGTAWVTCYTQVRGAFFGWLQVACEPAKVGSVADALAADPHAVTVAHTTGGGGDLIVALVTTDFFGFSRYVIERVHRVPGVLSVRSHPFARSYLEGSHWRLDGLNREQRAVLEASRTSAGCGPEDVLTDERPIALALTEDGRLPLTELAARTGVSVNTARRRLMRLVEADRIILRCELARFCSGWPITVIFWTRVPADRADSVARHVAALRQVRTCAITASGPNNLVFSAWLRTVEEIQQLETLFTREFPDITITDRSMILRQVKLVGSLLDVAGRRTGTVPMDIRQNPIAAD
jgi:DNA-binding Lrp family transcriptional regulator